MARRVTTLPRTGSWDVGVAELDLQGMTRRAYLVQEDGRLVLTAPESTGLRELMFDAMTGPLLGAPRRPREVRVSDPQLRRRLTKALKGSGVAVRLVERVDLSGARARVEAATRLPGVGIQLQLERWARALGDLQRPERVTRLQLDDGELLAKGKVIYLTRPDAPLVTLTLFDPEGESGLDAEARRLGLPVDRFVPQVSVLTGEPPSPAQQSALLCGVEALVATQGMPDGEHTVVMPEGSVQVTLARAG